MDNSWNRHCLFWFIGNDWFVFQVIGWIWGLVVSTHLQFQWQWERKCLCRLCWQFGGLQSSCMVGRCSRQTGCINNVRLSAGVDDCDIPRNCLSSRPWNECRSTRSVAVITREADWLHYSGNMSSIYGPPNDVIQVRVSLMSGCNLSARKAM